jgi:hypothetical protein
MTSRFLKVLYELTHDEQFATAVWTNILPSHVHGIHELRNITIELNLIQTFVQTSRPSVLLSHFERMLQTLDVYIPQHRKRKLEEHELRSAVRNMMDARIFALLEGVQTPDFDLDALALDVVSHHKVVLALLREGYLSLVPFGFEESRDIMLQAAKSIPRSAIKWLPPSSSFFKDDEFILTAIENDAKVLLAIGHDYYWDNRELMLKSLERNAQAIRYIEEETEDCGLILEAITRNVDVFWEMNRFNSPCLHDSNFMVAVSNMGVNVFKQIEPRSVLWKDRDFWMKVKPDKVAYRFLHDLREDSEIFEDSELMLKALHTDPNIGTLISPRLWNDRTFASKAMKVDARMTLYGTDWDSKLMRDRTFVLALMNQLVLQGQQKELDTIYESDHFIDCFSDDRVFILATLTLGSFKFASDKLKNDREIVMKALEIDGENLRFASEILRNDEQMIAIEQKWLSTNGHLPY